MLLRRSCLAVIAACAAVPSFVTTADASGPATVTVRVEGLTETLVLPKPVTTTTEPVVKDGNPLDACPGTSAIGALQVATGGNWQGKWYGGGLKNGVFEGLGYSAETVAGESHLFFSGSFWDVWVNHAELSVHSPCETEMEPGGEVLLFPCSEAGPCPSPLGITGPTDVNVGERAAFTVDRYNSGGEGVLASGATVTGGGASATTDAGGKAALTFSAPGEYTVRATAPEVIRAEMTICVHASNSGACGPQSASGLPTSSTSTTGANSGASSFLGTPYKGPYAIVAKATNLIEGHVYSRKDAPRVLAGIVKAHTTVASVSLKLRRDYKGRCTAYNGTREEFRPARCGAGSYFKVSTEPSFSYLLPSALAPGRYVLDIEATDAAGNRTALARGTSRTVFYVR